MKEAFEIFWSKLTNTLRSRKRISNWTAYSGYLPEGDFEAVYEGGDYIKCIVPNARDQLVPKKEFKLVFDNWQDYKEGSIKRSRLTQLSKHTKYIISIIHQLESESVSEDNIKVDDILQNTLKDLERVRKTFLEQGNNSNASRLQRAITLIKRCVET